MIHLSTPSRDALTGRFSTGLTLSLFLFCLALLENTPAIAAVSATMPVAPSYDSAVALAKSSGRPLLVEFYAAWCPWCHKFDSVTFHDSAASAWVSEKVFFVRENGETASRELTALAQKFGFRGFPHFIMLTPDGREIDRFGGYLPPEKFVATMNDFVRDTNTIGDYKRRLSRSATSENYFLVGEKYRGYSFSAQATQYLESARTADRANRAGFASRASMSLGALNRRDGHFHEAASFYRQCIERYPSSPQAPRAQFNLALCLLESRDSALAVGEFKSYLEKYPQGSGRRRGPRPTGVHNSQPEADNRKEITSNYQLN